MQQPQPNNNFNPQPSFNTNYMQQPMPNPEDITDPTTAMNMALIAQPVQNVENLVVHNAVQNPGVQNVGNQNGLTVVPGIANPNVNQNGNGNVVAARAEEDLDEIEETDQLSVEQDGRTVEQHPATVKETRAYFESLYNNLAIKVEKVNSVNRKMKETNADLTTKLARYKNQEKCFKISQEKYDKLERCYQKSVYQEQCLTKKINALHLSYAKTITTLNEEISNLNNQLSKEKSTVSFLNEEKKKLKPDFKIQRHDPPVVYDSEETLQLA
ncbi:hypothetical protein Tco_1286753 [Tanacetum coccineum]